MSPSWITLARAPSLRFAIAMPDHDRLILEQVTTDIERLRMQAAAIRQDLLAYLLDQAAHEAQHQLSREMP